MGYDSKKVYADKKGEITVSQYEVLLFDLDDTLLDFAADQRMAFEALYRARGYDQWVPYSPVMLETYEVHNRRWWDRFDKGQCSKEELFVGRFRDFLAQTSFSGDPVELNREYFAFLGQGGVALPGALHMLERLAGRFALYVVTNGYAASAESRVARSGVGRYLQGLFVSESVGAGKPDPRYFDYVFAHIPGFSREKALLIGDSLVTDIAGANAVGLDSVWYHPPGRGGADPDPCPATAVAHSFKEIESFLASRG